MTYEITRNTRFASFEIRFDGKPCDAVRDVLRGLRFRWHGVKKIWYGFAKSEDDLRTAIDGVNVDTPEIPEAKIVAPKTDKAAEAALMAEYRDRLVASGERERMIDYYVKSAGTLVKLTNGDIVSISKPTIETRFCFGESGYDMDDAIKMCDHAKTNEAYFKRENLKDLKGWIDLLSGVEVPYWKKCYVHRNSNGIASVYWDSTQYHFGDDEEISDADRALMLDGYKAAYAAFEKRLDTYLKRYGLSKIVTWTYWRDA